MYISHVYIVSIRNFKAIDMKILNYRPWTPIKMKRTFFYLQTWTMPANLHLTFSERPKHHCERHKWDISVRIGDFGTKNPFLSVKIKGRQFCTRFHAVE